MIKFAVLTFLYISQQVLGPRILEAVIAAWMDASTAKLARRLLGDNFHNAAVRLMSKFPACELRH